ncbi:hypothetical protein [Porcincola intestinalis]|nr:hypothetical protein [Porcincola intestinalis]
MRTFAPGQTSAVGRDGMMLTFLVRTFAPGQTSAAGRDGQLRPALCGSTAAMCGRSAELRDNRIWEEGGAGRAALSWA